MQGAELFFGFLTLIFIVGSFCVGILIAIIQHFKGD